MLKLLIFVLAVICSKCFSDQGHAICATIKRMSKGFTTSNGEPCKPCTTNKFGNKCAHTCHCTEEERCDSRHGCVPLHSDISTEKLSTLMYDSLQTTFPMNVSEQTMNIFYNESKHSPTFDYENKTYSTEGNGERINDSDYINYVIWTGCILFIILIVVSSSICYTLNNNLLLKHSANGNSILQEKRTKRAVLSRSESLRGPCDTINEETMCLDHDIIEIKVVTKEDLDQNINTD